MPGLCNVSPVVGVEGTTPVTYNGFNLTNNNSPQTIARFTEVPAIPLPLPPTPAVFIDSPTGTGNSTSFDNATVPAGTVTGKTKISVSGPSGGYCD